MQPRIKLLALAACSVTGCSLLVESGGLSGPSDRSPVPDEAGVDPAVVVAPEAGSETSDASDAMDANDAGDADASGLHPYVQAVLADGPSLYYRLEETADGPVKDEMGKHPGTYLAGGAHSLPGVFPGSLAFGLAGAGKGGIEAADLFDFEGTLPFTLEAWFLPDTIDGEFRFLFHQNELAGPRQSYGIYVQSQNGLAFERYIDGGGRTASYKGITTGAWRHIVGIYGSELLQIFVDGALVTATPDGRAAKDKTTPLRIGFGYADGTGALRGKLDEVAIYEKALSADRVAAHFQAAK